MQHEEARGRCGGGGMGRGLGVGEKYKWMAQLACTISTCSTRKPGGGGRGKKDK